LWPWSFTNRREREPDNGAAVRADGKVREGLLLLVRRQAVLGKRGELVRVGMVSGLEEFAHNESDAAVGAEAVLSENDAV